MTLPILLDFKPDTSISVPSLVGTVRRDRMHLAVSDDSHALSDERHRGRSSHEFPGHLLPRATFSGRSECLKYARIKMGVPRFGKISSHHDLESRARRPGVDRSPYLKISLRNGAGLKCLQRSGGRENTITGTHTGNTKCNWLGKMFSRLFSHRETRQPVPWARDISDSAAASAQRIRLTPHGWETSDVRQRTITPSSSRFHATTQFARDLTNWNDTSCAEKTEFN
jgi:hypothetical protein